MYDFSGAGELAQAIMALAKAEMFLVELLVSQVKYMRRVKSQQPEMKNIIYSKLPLPR
ncbi:hypothetical protein ACFLXL_00370 [Chloroflexota bacterium]